MNPQKMIDGVLVERLPDGRIVPVGQQGQMPANPEFPYKGPQAGANLQKTRAEIENDRKNTDLAQQKFVADLYKEGLQPGPNGPVPIPGWQKPNAAQGGRPDATKAQFDDALAQYNAADFLTKEIGKLRDSYAKGPGSTSGLAGIGDFFPTRGNQGFDKASGRLRAFAKQGTGTTGGENNSVAEMKLNLGSYIPAASDWDSTNTDTFTSLQELADKTRSEAIQRLGGIPDASGRIVPLGAQNAMTQNYVLPGTSAGAADMGSDTQSVPVPDGMQRAHQAYIAAHAGNLEPAAYARFRQEQDKQYGYPVTPEKEDEYRAFAEQANKAAQRGGSTINPNIPNVDQPLSGLDAFRNNMVNNPIGAAAVGALDMGGFGAVSALAPGQMQSLADESPWNAGAMMAGQIGGAMAGTSALGKLGTETLARALPKLMQGGSMGRMGRALATDGVYGTVTGTNQGMDPTTAALSSIVGSGAGQALGGAGGKLIGGINKTAEAGALNARGIPTTFGQNVGGFVKSAEDAMTSMPIAGDMISARALDSRRAFNREAFNEGGLPIGFNPNATGAEGITRLGEIKAQMFSNALDPASINTLADPQYLQDFVKVRGAANSIPNVEPSMPRDYSVSSLKNRMHNPVDANGVMSGRDFQESYRGLARDARARSTGDYGNEIAATARQGQDALAGVLERQNPGAFEGFRNANTVHRNQMTLANAVEAAKNQPEQLFTPAQLTTADAASARRLTGPLASASGQRPFYDLANIAQAVLRNPLPDSGTGKRLLVNALALGGIGGAGAGYGAATDEGAMSGTMKALAIAGALGLGGTKKGQAFINKALIDRPAIVRKAGRAISKRKGLFGAAGVPLALESSN